MTMTLEFLAARLKKVFAATIVSISAFNIPLFAGTMTIHVRDNSNAAIVNAVVYGLVYGDHGPDGTKTQVQAVDGTTGDATFATLDPASNYTFVASAPGKGPMAQSQMMSATAPRFRGDTTTTESTIKLSQSLDDRATIRLTVQHGTPGSFIMANVHKNSSNSDVQVGGCLVDGSGSDCTIDLYNIPPAASGTYDVGVFDPNLFAGAGGGLGTRINVALQAGDTNTPTLDLNNAFPPNVSSTGNLRPDANNAVITISLRKTGTDVVIPHTGIQLMTKDGNGNLFPNGGGQTDDSGVVQFRVGVGKYYVQTVFTCPDGGTCYDGIQPVPSNVEDVNIASGDLNTTINKVIEVSVAPEGTGKLAVEIVKAGDLTTRIPFSNINIGPDWSQWSNNGNGTVDCNAPAGVSSNPGKTQKNAQASDGTVLLDKLTDGNYMLQVWTQFSQSGTTFNGGPDGTFNWGNGIRGCTDQIAASDDDLRLTVSGTTVKVYDKNGADVSSTYVGVDSSNNPKIQIPVRTSADSATGVVHGTLTFPENNDALVSITLQGECGQNGCAGNFTTVHAGNTKTVDYSINVPETNSNNEPAQYYVDIRSDQYGPVYANGGQNQISFHTGSNQVVQNFTMAASGIVQGTLYNPDGSIFLPKDGQNNLQASVQLQGNNSWGNANVDRNGNFRAISLLPGKYNIDVQIFGNTTTSMTGKKPAESVIVTAGATVTHDAHLVNADYILPEWDLTGLPALFNEDVPNRGIRGETYSVLTAKTGSQIDGDFIRNILTNHDEKTQFSYIPVASNNNSCGPSWTGWCGAFEPDGQAADYFAVRKSDIERVTMNGVTKNLYGYVLFLQKKENVAVDPSKRSGATVSPNGTSVQPIRVSFAPDYSGEFISVSGTVKAANMFRAIDFTKMGGDFNKFVQYIPMITVQNEQGQVVAAGIVTPSAEHVGDSSVDGDAIDNAVNNGDFAAFKLLVANWDWSFQINGLPKGHKYFLALTSPNYAALTKTIDGTKDETWTVDWDNDGSAGGTVQGTVSDSGGNLANAFVEIRTRGTVKNVTTDSNGSYKFEGLPAGNYKVTASAADHAPRAKRVRVAGTASESMDLTLPASDATISGTVSKYAAVSGAFLKVPADQVKVIAYDDTFNVSNPTEPLPVVQTETASDGTYTLAGAQSGDTYKVSFQLDGYTVEPLAVAASAGTNTGNDALLRKKGLEVKIKITHDAAAQQYVVSILNPNNFESGQIFLGPVETPFVQGNATDISGAFQQQPDGSLIGTIADSDVGTSNKNLHIIAVPADGSPDVINDYVFGPSVSDRLEQPIGDMLVAADGDNDVSGADGRTTVTIEPGVFLSGNDDTTPALGLATFTQDALGGTVADGGSLVGNGVQLTFSNTQVNPDKDTCASFPIDPALIDGGFDPKNLQLKEQDSQGNWQTLTSNVSFDPITNTVLGCFNVATNVNEAPLNIRAAGGSVGAAKAAAVKQAAVTMSATKTAKALQKNLRAAATTAAIFSVGLAPSTSTVTAIGYHQYNFPNPFNLKDKTVTLRSGTSGVPTTIRGTYIVVAPTGSGSAEINIKIYNVAGDMVRELSGTGTAGKYNYFHWDGKNTSGSDVASGVYFAVVDAPGAPKKEPIKMVVVK
jgi:flagellar hook assembly protein FlgD